MIFPSLNDVTYYIVIWRFRKCSLVGFKWFNFLTVNKNLGISLKGVLTSWIPSFGKLNISDKQHRNIILLSLDDLNKIMFETLLRGFYWKSF